VGVDPKGLDIESIFATALLKTDPADRTSFLDETCGRDFELRASLERLLEAFEETGDSLDDPAAQSDAVATIPAESRRGDRARGRRAPQPFGEGVGSVIGPYVLVGRLGEGGMGTVYLAEQERPVRRRVALKIIKPGMDSYQVIARFEAERQALAFMDQENIARVFDAGTTDTGRPYFVMELVKGLPITDYCDRNRLSLFDRLELMLPVCRAIQHAHQKGIIHRDLKPSNVVVTLAEKKPVPKVVDFGIAQAIDQRLTEKMMFTQMGTVEGTLDYVSPEQAEMGAVDIDTRTDIYSLGVLLYELVTGTTPLSRATLRQGGYVEIIRQIRETEPPQPSTRLAELSETLPSISSARNTEPSKLAKLLKGEIDWIVMKALAKDRAHRYESAGGLSREIERYLNGEPVEAGPPSATYRLRKLARKYQGLLATSLAFVAILFGAALLSTYLAIRANRALTLARQEATAAEAERQSEATQRHKAEDERYLTALNNLAMAYLPSKPAAAESLLRDCLSMRDQIAPDAWETFDTRSLLGASLSAQKKYAEAEPLLLQAYDGLKARETKIPAPYSARVAQAGLRLVELYDAWGKEDQATLWRQRLGAR
jgi:serine/threonine protein kinase